MQAKFYLLAGTILVLLHFPTPTKASDTLNKMIARPFIEPYIQKLADSDRQIGELETRLSELMATLARTQAALARAEAAEHHAQEEGARKDAVIAAQARLIEELDAASRILVTRPEDTPKEEDW